MRALLSCGTDSGDITYTPELPLWEQEEPGTWQGITASFQRMQVLWVQGQPLLVYLLALPCPTSSISIVVFPGSTFSMSLLHLKPSSQDLLQRPSHRIPLNHQPGPCFCSAPSLSKNCSHSPGKQRQTSLSHLLPAACAHHGLRLVPNSESLS